VEQISDALIREAAQRLGEAARKPARVILNALSPVRVPAELLVISHDEAAQPERAGEAVRDALTEGVVLYESP
jgi:hypothetical protein